MDFTLERKKYLDNLYNNNTIIHTSFIINLKIKNKNDLYNVISNPKDSNELSIAKDIIKYIDLKNNLINSFQESNYYQAISSDFVNIVFDLYFKANNNFIDLIKNYKKISRILFDNIMVHYNKDAKIDFISKFNSIANYCMIEDEIEFICLTVECLESCMFNNYAILNIDEFVSEFFNLYKNSMDSKNKVLLKN